jgi:hypothetical protein
MTMRTSLGQKPDAVQCAPPPRARDPKVGPLAHRLRDLGYSTTPGGAHAKLLRLRLELRQVVAVAVTDGYDLEFDQYMLEVDELRTAGLHLELGTDGMLTIERADAEDNHPRVRYYLEPTLDNARAAKYSAKRAVVALFEFLRGLRTAHPDLTS